MANLIILIFAYVTLTVAISTNPSSGPILPPMWCDDDTIAEKVGVLDQCRAYNTTAHGKRIKITVLYETLCGACQLLITSTVYPYLWKMGKEFIDIELVPYGNAHHEQMASGTYNITCQHGSDECRSNKFHSCVIAELGDPAGWMPFINCLESKLAQGDDPDKAIEQCYTQEQIKPSERTKIDQCANGPKGDELQKIAADRTDAVGPEEHQWVPWILINDVSTMNGQVVANQFTLFNFLCAWYRGDTVPPGCQQFTKAKARTVSLAR